MPMCLENGEEDPSCIVLLIVQFSCCWGIGETWCSGQEGKEVKQQDGRRFNSGTKLFGCCAQMTGENPSVLLTQSLLVFFFFLV